MDDELLQELVTRLTNEQLVFWVGAGVSMGGGAPLPSAPALTNDCASKYQQEFGQVLPLEATDGLESLTEYFYNSDNLVRTFIHRLVPWERFRNGEPNQSHIALADTILSGSAPLVISTNYDNRIETAARNLGEQDFVANLDISEPEPIAHSRLLKIHGCADRDRNATFWCQQQRTDSPIRERLDSAVHNLPGILLNKDLVLVGYWTDWVHMYSAICEILGGCEPQKVYVVNPASDEELAEMAPELWAWLNQKNHQILHLYSDDFFSSLRREYSASSIRKAFTACIDVYKEAFEETNDPDVSGPLPDNLDDLYAIRQDLTGTPRDCAVGSNHMSDEGTKLAAAFTLYTLINGTTFHDGFLEINDKKYRFLGDSGLLAIIKQKYQNEPRLLQQGVTIICPSAVDDGGAATNIVRQEETGHIFRGDTEGDWLGFQQGRIQVINECQ